MIYDVNVCDFLAGYGVALDRISDFWQGPAWDTWVEAWKGGGSYGGVGGGRWSSFRQPRIGASHTGARIEYITLRSFRPRHSRSRVSLTRRDVH